ncbi:MAG: hypothetical protein ACLGQW_08745, partial [Acidobacteriota bacterium]
MRNEIDLQVLKALLPLAADQDIRYYLKGVYVSFETARTVYVATDGAVLGVYEAAAANEHAFSVIIPREVVKQVKLAKILVLGALDLEDPRHARLDNPANGQNLGFQPVEGVFPDFRRAIPAKTSGEAGNYNVDLLGKFSAANKVFGAKFPGALDLQQN